MPQAVSIPTTFRRARPLVIDSDAMAPTLRPRVHIAFVMPVQTFTGEGIYALMCGLGGFEVWRVSSYVRNKIHLSHDNKVLRDSRTVTQAEFEECVAGKVAGVMEFYDRSDYADMVARCGELG